MGKQLLLGAEAVALGAIDAGISGVYAYPGTPSTEITEYIQKSKEAQQKSIRSSWSANEKTAYEAALGMSYAGKRTLVCMKHVGINVAADAFINSAITGVNGGLVMTVADDPSMHSSQNEQDSRFYGKFAMVPVVEPSSQQEVYDAVIHAFELSEKVKLPVIIRITTRLSHSRAGVERTAAKEQNRLAPETENGKFVLLPAIARKRYKGLVDIQDDLVKLSEASPFTNMVEGTGSFGVIAFGIGFNYAMEVNQRYGLNIPVLKVGQYPLPDKQIREFFDKHEKVLLAEEGYPVYEELLRGYFDNAKIAGRLDGALPRVGELNPDFLAMAMGIKKDDPKPMPDVTSPRPPMLCQGCGHSDMYEALNLALEEYDHHVFADIGCYTLGALPPYRSIQTCVDMGASVTMAKGASDAGIRPAVAVIGDSTFTHSGMTGLLDAVNDGTTMTLIIADNDTTGMTGGQDSAATGRLFSICKGLGVDEAHIREIIPIHSKQEENVKVFKEEFEYEGVSVVIAHRECIQTLMRKKRDAKKKAEAKN